jgi:hypothetical protein
VRVVVFGGGTPTLFPSNVVVQTVSELTAGALNNDGERIYLVLPGTTNIGLPPDTADTVLEFAFGGAGEPVSSYNQSITRYPQGADAWLGHAVRDDPDRPGSNPWSVSPGYAPDNDQA